MELLRVEQELAVGLRFFGRQWTDSPKDVLFLEEVWKLECKLLPFVIFFISGLNKFSLHLRVVYLTGIFRQNLPDLLPHP